MIACSSAKNAQTWLSRIAMDAILTDHKLDGESGIEFIRGLRQQGVTGPIVMVTASADPEVERAAYEAGANKVFSAGRGDFSAYLHEVLSRV
ncbi:MAG: response regulator [Opitutaceae bacterium]|nr:response regulator [Opitutaceae bacterium]